MPEDLGLKAFQARVSPSTSSHQGGRYVDRTRERDRERDWDRQWERDRGRGRDSDKDCIRDPHRDKDRGRDRDRAREEYGKAQGRRTEGERQRSRERESRQGYRDGEKERDSKNVGSHDRGFGDRDTERRELGKDFGLPKKARETDVLSREGRRVCEYDLEKARRREMEREIEREMESWSKIHGAEGDRKASKMARAKSDGYEDEEDRKAREILLAARMRERERLEQERRRAREEEVEAEFRSWENIGTNNEIEQDGEEKPIIDVDALQASIRIVDVISDDEHMESEKEIHEVGEDEENEEEDDDEEEEDEEGGFEEVDDEDDEGKERLAQARHSKVDEIREGNVDENKLADEAQEGGQGLAHMGGYHDVGGTRNTLQDGQQDSGMMGTDDPPASLQPQVDEWSSFRSPPVHVDAHVKVEATQRTKLANGVARYEGPVPTIGAL